jgi:hypothetical protein
MVPRKQYQVSNGTLIVATVEAYSAEGACEIIGVRLGIPVHQLTAKLTNPPKAALPNKV